MRSGIATAIPKIHQQNRSERENECSKRVTVVHLTYFCSDNLFHLNQVEDIKTGYKDTIVMTPGPGSAAFWLKELRVCFGLSKLHSSQWFTVLQFQQV